MNRNIDRAAGFATFREGRSFCIRLRGTIGASAARRVAEAIRAERDVVRLRLECSALEDAEPAAAGILTGAVLRWLRAGGPRAVDVLNLDPAVERRIGWHPLRSTARPGLLDGGPDDPAGRPGRD